MEINFKDKREDRYSISKQNKFIISSNVSDDKIKSIGKIAISKSDVDKANNRVRYNRIAITPFKVEDEYPEYPKFNPEKRFVHEDYVIVNSRLLCQSMIRCTKSAFEVLNHIWYNMRPETNILTLSVSKIVKDISASLNTILKGVESLKLANIIQRTNLRNTYIIDHNLFFKGNINKFVKEYRKLYGNAVAQIDETTGQVIINSFTNNARKAITTKKALSVDEYIKKYTAGIFDEPNPEYNTFPLDEEDDY